jgi:hypothetical protein
MDCSSAQLRNVCLLVGGASLVATLVFRSAFWAVPGCVAAGFFFGHLAKKQFAPYNYARNFLYQAYSFDNAHKKVRWVVLAVVFVTSLIFPLIAAAGAFACGTLCGALYNE